jgi:hypothetical protein
MNRSALVALKRGLRAYFDANGIGAATEVGWTARSRIDNQGFGGANRVVLAPGFFDPNEGAPRARRAGKLDRNAEQNQIDISPGVASTYQPLRVIAWLHQDVTCCVWAVDTDHPQDEELQLEATETLLEYTLQGLHLANDPETQTSVGFANIEEWGEAFWTLPPGEMAFGRELTFSLVLLVPFFDQPVGLAYPGPSVGRDPSLT